MVKVSVIVPVYNVEDYLAKCLDSLVKQTLEDIEIIVVNDGSTDGSQTIIDSYVNKYPDKVICFTKENGGQASARNFALTKATGEYISFVDSDDWVDTNMFKVMLNSAKKSNADIIISKASAIKNSQEVDDELSYYPVNDTIKNYIVNQACPWGKLIKKSLILDNDLFFPNLRAYEDVAVVPSFALFSRNIVELNEKFYYYLIRTGSTMNQTKYSAKLEQIFLSLTHLEDIFKKEEKYNEYIQELEYLYIEHLLHAASLRFFAFDNYEKNIKKVVETIKEKYPNWRKNKYYKKENLKYKVVCNLFYLQQYSLLKILLK